ncbi:hypothetical protein [Erythrobacter donghaensis]|jgi:hypothetical protein|uniref:hypothetical protein n=2 Tax=Erythrobacter donghaensis TaxID=267135 RepID=UPI00093C724A|nr:hypothetical protein [Erythrobacter donghaensis]
MGKETMDLAADDAVEAILRGGLAREARALTAVVPVLRHLLGTEAQGLVSEAILARVRGMILDIAAQLLAAQAGRDPAARVPGGDPAALDALAEGLMGEEALLAHCHALATESLLADRLQQRHAIDPVLSPLLQELIAAEDPAVAALAMATLAAQSRFVQSQRRMELALGELPAELFHALLARVPGGTGDGAGLARLQAGYDEATSRLGLLARLVAAMRRGAVAALALEHAGLALFAAAIASETRCPRGEAVLACQEGQGVRLALLLRAAGLAVPAIERQMVLAEPAAQLPSAIGALTPARAAALLGAGRLA